MSRFYRHNPRSTVNKMSLHWNIHSGIIFPHAAPVKMIAQFSLSNHPYLCSRRRWECVYAFFSLFTVAALWWNVMPPAQLVCTPAQFPALLKGHLAARLLAQFFSIPAFDSIFTTILMLTRLLRRVLNQKHWHCSIVYMIKNILVDRCTQKELNTITANILQCFFSLIRIMLENCYNFNMTKNSWSYLLGLTKILINTLKI